MLEMAWMDIGRNWDKWWVLHVLLQKEEMCENMANRDPKKIERK